MHESTRLKKSEQSRKAAMLTSYDSLNPRIPTSLSDILEADVAEKYFLSDTMMNNLMANMDKLKTFQVASTPITTKETAMGLEG